MNAYLNYVIEANIGLLLFLVCYRILLTRETHFTLLRIFLLAGIFLSLLFPLIHMENNNGGSVVSVRQVIPSNWAHAVILQGEAPAQSESKPNFWVIASALYIGGLMFFTMRTFFQLSQLLRTMRRAKPYRLRTLRIVESHERKPTFSFFNFIFIGDVGMLSATEKQRIIQHESAHAEQRHSLDILLINLLKIVFWFNPAINTYKKTLIHLHEFDADMRAVRDGGEGEYCSLLAKVALKQAGFSLANHFNNSLTLKRIEMIKTMKTKISHWKIAACALLIPVTFLLLSCQDQVENSMEGTVGLTSEVDERASPTAEFYNDLRRHITYPAVSRVNHKYGRVLLGFVVNANGSLSDIQILESPDDVLAKEAVRVLSRPTLWIPAKKGGIAVGQRLVLPIRFKLDFPGMAKDEQQNLKEAPLPEESLNEIVVVGYAN